MTKTTTKTTWRRVDPSRFVLLVLVVASLLRLLFSVRETRAAVCDKPRAS